MSSSSVSSSKVQNGALPQAHPTPVLVRKASRKNLSSGREKEMPCTFISRHLSRGKVAMLLLVALALLIFLFSSFAVYNGFSLSLSLSHTPITFYFIRVGSFFTLNMLC